LERLTQTLSSAACVDKVARQQAIRKVTLALSSSRHGYFPTCMEVTRMAVRLRQPYVMELTTEQWAIWPLLIPLATRGGRPQAVYRRDVMLIIYTLNRTGCPWVLRPHARLLKSTVLERPASSGRYKIRALTETLGRGTHVRLAWSLLSTQEE
jgi:transposase